MTVAPIEHFDFELHPTPLSPEAIAKLPTAIIYDLDGFLVDSSERARKYIDVQAKADNDYVKFERSIWDHAQSCELDIPIPMGVDIIKTLIDRFQPDACFALTSRGEIERAHTLMFMREHFPWEVRDEWLLMNPQLRVSVCGTYVYAHGAWFDHVQYKRWRVRQLQQEYRILFAGDDHGGVVEMYHQEGITAIRILHSAIDCLSTCGDKVKTLPLNLTK